MEGALAVQHLVEDAPHTVYIAFVVYGPSSLLESFGGEVKRGAEEGFSVVIFVVELFGQSEVYEVNVSFWVEHYVLWFEVSVNDPILMEVLNGKYEFRDDDECSFGREYSVILDVLAEVSSGHVLQCQIQELRGLEGIVKWDDVLAFPAFDQGLELSERIFHLISEQQFFLLELFQGVNAVVAFC